MTTIHLATLIVMDYTLENGVALHPNLQSITFLSLWLVLALSLALSIIPAQASELAQEVACGEAIIHYRRSQSDYDGWGLHVWGEVREQVTWQAPLEPARQDEYGLVWIARMQEGAGTLNYIVHKGDIKDPGPDQSMTFAESGCEIWLIQGKETQYADPESAILALEMSSGPAPEPGTDQVVLHYRRVKGDYDGWGLHIWGEVREQVTWTAPLLPSGQDDYGLYWVVEMKPGAEILNYIVHRGDEKDPGPDQSLEISAVGREIWLIEGSGDQFTDIEMALEALLVAGVGDIKNRAQAHWLSAGVIAWPIEFGPLATYRLHFDSQGSIQVTQTGLQGGQEILLEFADDNLSPDLGARYPHLRTAVMLEIPEEHLALVPEILKGQYAVSVTGPDGSILGATALQIPGVLDDLYANDEPLGVIWEGPNPSLQVWAPTARRVTLHLFRDSNPETIGTTLPMEWKPGTGVWSIRGEPSWEDQYYLYEVEVFIRQEGAVVHNLVSDPYSLSLAMNSTRSQVVNLDNPALKPRGWDDYTKPEFANPEDILLYELHVRDFSAFDGSVPAEHRNKYLAFTHTESDGMRHLHRLTQAGITHLHLLPVFDIATIDEDTANRLEPDYSYLESLPPNSDGQQAALAEIRGRDGYNWGYDPFHYTVPEGSYATNPDGPTRILEFRQMVYSLNQAGLRVVMDVVYNHTHAAGQGEKSVLDRIVPGYYHRLDRNGNVTTSTCCPNTASEHFMMEKLMRDSLLTWATAYKIDGFRFDLMGHHMLTNMETLRDTLHKLEPGADGVDGQSIYLYGEGWNFGEVADNARGINATQRNLEGSGIGSFNDRIRDAARGGNPFTGPQEQGFITGLYTQPNQADPNPEKTRLALLLDLKDQIRVSLAGNLAEYQLINAAGQPVIGAQIGYNGQPAGYTADPQENILYVSSHDNETLFDAIQYKAPLDTSMENRVRMNNLGISLVALGQGVPFFQAGTELLRSKSLDRDSYDSGDWFNRLDFTYTTNNWGVGLPPQDKNGANWPLMLTLLERPELKPGREHILATLAHFEEMLRIRNSSPLFRLTTAEAIYRRVRFHNTGPDQVPGLIVMSLSDDPMEPLDPAYDLIVVLFNADPANQTFTLSDLHDAELELHPMQLASADPLVHTALFEAVSRTFRVPGLTTAIFVGRGNLDPSRDLGVPESDETKPLETPSQTEERQQSSTPEDLPANESGVTVPSWALIAGLGLIGGLYLAAQAVKLFDIPE